jgi:hypothetical protein
MGIKLKLDFDFPDSEFEIKHSDSISLMGSCFSDEIGNHFKSNGFKTISNPFGTIFHPIPLAQNMLDSLNGKAQEQIYHRKDLFFSWDAAENIFDYSAEGIAKKMESLRNQVQAELTAANVLFITFGTGFEYRSTENQEVVANCHKAPGDLFVKSLTPLSELVSIWESALTTLRKINPTLQIVFTVSPVRHSKDGLMENNRSKARLFELISNLEENSNCHYFPAYEIVVDELRDYRFYKSDGVHPNNQAVEYVWNSLTEKMMADETRQLCQKVLSFRKAENHRTLHENSEESKLFQKKHQENLAKFLKDNPTISW